MRSAIIIRVLQCNNDIAVVRQRQPLPGDGWPCYIATQRNAPRSLKPLALIGFTRHPSVQREARLFTEPGESQSFDVTLRTNDLPAGLYTGSLTVEHDGDNPVITIGFFANITVVSDGDGSGIPSAPLNVSASEGSDSEIIKLTRGAIDSRLLR
jgi:hypothetical protein